MTEGPDGPVVRLGPRPEAGAEPYHERVVVPHSEESLGEGDDDAGVGVGDGPWET